MHLFAGSSHPALAQAIAKQLSTELAAVDLKGFSCGERYVRYVDSVRGKDVYIVQTGSPNINEHLMELFLMCQAAKLSFAKSVHVIMPNFPYARQDRVAHWREPISAKLIAQLLEESGADHVLTLNLHSPQIQGFFSIPADALNASRIFADYIEAKNLKDLIIVAPDVGGAKYAKTFADMIGAEIAILHKTRPEHHKAEILDVVGNIEGRTCIIYDDMIDTAGTLLTAKQALLDRGANKDVYAAATHAIFSGPAISRLQEAGFAEVIVTDTMPVDSKAFKGLTVLSVAPLIAQVISHVERGESVTEIYGTKKK
ncbi:ribose-phosphate pyrophosphokinase [Candidatus Peregrinibacteria bacterium CG10_big_fil_rev_8_21_14_0_10_49_24]|nr:MAG: ribose-phosphate pyrophosphokinase [Candidatus Peregrinibacteria bacterium CG11_big_fil_rev_8_21_14_0_20_49_14]PIR51096.1 MAG: ribose-phosphate pyrophosphokinase [Candidatus Peregrinibacteria bacterium CG10_big_fil_rev_8_21_14_0_10_49_24]PJA67649.1 MAG: ribose-phosphate pyrophosphokinase [Candidatus Peregrinibacteria bacterium CG_4_9_14_3_um_filter_49_12]